MASTAKKSKRASNVSTMRRLREESNEISTVQEFLRGRRADKNRLPKRVVGGWRISVGDLQPDDSDRQIDGYCIET